MTSSIDRRWIEDHQADSDASADVSLAAASCSAHPPAAGGRTAFWETQGSDSFH